MELPRAGAERDKGPSPFLPLARIWEELLRAAPGEMSWHVLNIGAYDGVAMGDPCALLRHRATYRTNYRTTHALPCTSPALALVC